ncbi:MAG: class I SAM-dependent methyltransferase [Candidatus Eremiobacteraeota bacterium]|nr:class I SAM-dependent methyltransferase [Candidatus Eremiobacteraeota bacterium]
MPSTAYDAYLEKAKALLAKGVATFGLPSSGPLYDANLMPLINPDANGLRINNLPQIVGVPDILTRSQRMLDVGFGAGLGVYRWLREGHDAYGVDLDDAKFELARAAPAAFGYPSEWSDRLLLCDAGNLPYPDQSFDIVTSGSTIEHVADLPAVLYEAVRVTRRNGFLHLMAPDYGLCSREAHYSLPWPRFMPAEQAKRWTLAMGRPSDGVGTFYYITAQQVAAILQYLNCKIVLLKWVEYFDGTSRPFTGPVEAETIVFQSQADISEAARWVQDLERAGQLPQRYRGHVEFTIVAQRL